MIDPSIITQGAIAAQEQQQRNLAALQDFGGSIGQLFLGRRVAQMRQLGTPEEQQQFANKSIYSRQLNTQRKLDTAEALKIKNAEEDRQYKIKETLANIGKINAESGKIGAEAGKVSTETGGMRYNTATQAWQVAAQYGPNAGKMLLAHQLAAGAIDQPTHDAQVAQLSTLDGLSPEDASNAAYAQFKATLDPKYNFTTPDQMAVVNASIQNNDADNKTISDNNAEDNKTRIITTGMTTSTSAANNANTVNASLQRAQIAGQAKGRETIAQQNERVATGIRLSQAASEAARASKAALDLSSHPGIKWGTGWTAASGIVPSTDAKAFRTDLENLKSQLFLPTIQQMRGMGALSNAEGAKVEAAVQNLDPSVGEVEMKRRLRLVEQGMSRLAQMSAKESKLYSQSGRSTQPQQQAAQGTGGRTMSIADAKRAAAMAKISYADAVKSLAAQGITVK